MSTALASQSLPRLTRDRSRAAEDLRDHGYCIVADGWLREPLDR